MEWEWGRILDPGDREKRPWLLKIPNKITDVNARLILEVNTVVCVLCDLTASIGYAIALLRCLQSYCAARTKGFAVFLDAMRTLLCRAFSPYHQGQILGPIPNSKYPHFFRISPKKSQFEAKNLAFFAQFGPFRYVKIPTRRPWLSRLSCK